MARRVLKKLERVISTKILKADFPQIMEEAKDLHSKKIISQPTMSAFIRFAISRYRQSAQAQAKSGDAIQMLPSGITMATDEGVKPQVAFEQVYQVFPNETRVVNFGGQSSQVGFEQVLQVLPDGVSVYRVGGQPSPVSSGEVIQVLPDGVSVYRVGGQPSPVSSGKVKVLPDGTSLTRVPCSYLYSG
jgi:hypothetical protein